ncbi:MAG: hypothetical protein FWF46_02855 [Oscillospiraceae bacterium]|nr:hypothetical protein [Oscillospiraceae bacterium]
MSSNVVIEKAEYSWNDGVSNIIEGNSTANLTQDLVIPEGQDSVFKLTVTDINGNTKDFEGTYTGQSAVDTTPPVIELSPPSNSDVGSDSKLEITARTTTSTILSYITYKWDNGDETKINATDDQTTINATIDIPDGTHTVTVVAVKENGVDATQQGTYTGIKKPTISVVEDSTGQYLVITMADDKAITDASIVLNGKNRAITADQFGVPQIIKNIPMDPGQNTITITVTNQDGATQSYTGQYTNSNSQ